MDLAIFSDLSQKSMDYKNRRSKQEILPVGQILKLITWKNKIYCMHTLTYIRLPQNMGIGETILIHRSHQLSTWTKPALWKNVIIMRNKVMVWKSTWVRKKRYWLEHRKLKAVYITKFKQKIFFMNYNC